jgi:hypothetical protein
MIDLNESARKLQNFYLFRYVMECGWKIASLLTLTPLNNQYSSTTPAVYCSLMDVHEPAPDLAEEILDDGSPTSTRSGDPTLLDMDRDCPEVGLWLMMPTWTRQW